ncbi:MAG: sulfatase-like hydrolase/transferase [Acidobacteriota bacterium]
MAPPRSGQNLQGHLKENPRRWFAQIFFMNDSGLPPARDVFDRWHASTARSLFVLAGALASLACSPEQARSVPYARQSAPPIILISIDTLRSDHLPAYGYGKVKTPAIDRFRGDAILFSYAYSNCPMTLPSHLSMLTGLLPPEHGVRNNLGYRFDAAHHANIPGWLRERGYLSAASVSSSVLRGETGMADMFDHYDDAIPVGNGGFDSGHQRDGHLAASAAMQWIAAHREQKFFVFLHLYEPHAPYDPPEPFRSAFASKYDGEIASADEITGGFLQYLRDSGIYDRALIILTSDHGEGLMDHGEDQHGILLYRESIQVPLLVKLPGNSRRGTAEDRAVQLIDLFPTITDVVAGGGPPGKLRGKSLLVNDDGTQETIYSETWYPRIHLGWSALRSEIDGEHHYIESPRPELYRLRSDPGEKTNVISSERRAAATLRDLLAAIPAGAPAPAVIDPKEASVLASLGYLGRVSSQQQDASLRNPVDEIHSLESVKPAFLLADQGRFDEAIPALQAALQKNPGLLDARERLGECLIAAGRYEEAIDSYRQAIAGAKRFSPDMALGLAQAQLLAGKTGEARTSAALAMGGNPMRAHELMARSALAEGRLDEADREASLALQTRNPQPTLTLIRAEILRARGDLRGAMAALSAADDQAKALKLEHVFGLDALRGDLLARMNREKEAEAAYNREIHAFPNNLQAWANLAVIYRVQDRTGDIDRLLQRMVEENPQPHTWSVALNTLHNLELPDLERTWRKKLPAAISR